MHDPDGVINLRLDILDLRSQPRADDTADRPLLPGSRPLLLWPSLADTAIGSPTVHWWCGREVPRTGRPDALLAHPTPDRHESVPSNGTYLLVSARLHTAWSSSTWPALLASGDIRVIRFARPEESASFQLCCISSRASTERADLLVVEQTKDRLESSRLEKSRGV